MKFAKILSHARAPEQLLPNDPGVSVFSAEDFTLGFGECHSYRTGIVVGIEDGFFGLLKESQAQGVKGIMVAGGFVTENDASELRVTLYNGHREAYIVKAGMPIAQLVSLPLDSADAEPEEMDKETLIASVKARTAAALADVQKKRATASAKKASDDAAAKAATAKAAAEATAKRAAEAADTLHGGKGNDTLPSGTGSTGAGTVQGGTNKS